MGGRSSWLGSIFKNAQYAEAQDKWDHKTMHDWSTLSCGLLCLIFKYFALLWVWPKKAIRLVAWVISQKHAMLQYLGSWKLAGHSGIHSDTIYWTLCNKLQVKLFPSTFSAFVSYHICWHHHGWQLSWSLWNFRLCIYDMLNNSLNQQSSASSF